MVICYRFVAFETLFSQCAITDDVHFIVIFLSKVFCEVNAIFIYATVILVRQEKVFTCQFFYKAHGNIFLFQSVLDVFNSSV